jgi:hypothetical protein
MTRNKLSKVLLLASLAISPVVASADPPTTATEVPVDDGVPSFAVRTERDAGSRVAYYAALTTIAERDSATAQITIDMAEKQQDIAIQKHDDDTALYWAGRRQAAVAEQRDARERASRFQAERDRARGDFRAAATELRKVRDHG